jgi:hypothetical protein
MQRFKSKTFWTGIASIVSGIILAIDGDYPQAAPLILGGLSAIFLRDAITKISVE